MTLTIVLITTKVDLEYWKIEDKAYNNIVYKIEKDSMPQYLEIVRNIKKTIEYYETKLNQLL